MKSLTQIQAIKFSSSDSEGSDYSYVSSENEEKAENDQGEAEKNVQLLKDQMNHFFLTHPEFRKNMELESFDFLEDYYDKKDELKKKRSEVVEGVKIEEKSPNKINNEKKDKNKYADYWGKLSGNILKETKKTHGPSIDFINQRLNLFRMEADKPSVHEVLLAESKQTNNFQNSKKSKLLSNEEKKKKEIHEKAEAKLREETGDVQYFSYKKKVQFQFRINKEERKLHEERKEKEGKQSGHSSSPQKNKKIASENEKKGPSIFERLFLDANGKQNNQEKLVEMEEPLDKELKTATGEELYRKLKNCPDEESIKRTALNYLNNYKAKTEEGFNTKNNLLSQIPRFYGDESKEFNIFFPDFSYAKNMSEKEIEEIFEGPEKLDEADGNIFLLKKMKKIMNGSIVKYWKQLQDAQKTS